jgi:hypothetical protein
MKQWQLLSITCTVSEFSITTSSYCWTLICQEPEKILKRMGCLCYDWNTNYSPSLRSCMSISRDPSKNQFSMQMSSVTPEINAVFREQSCEPLCKRHSEGTSMWSLTQMSHAGMLMTDTWQSTHSKLIYSPNGQCRHIHALFLLKFWFLPNSSFQTPPCTMILAIFPVWDHQKYF